MLALGFCLDCPRGATSCFDFDLGCCCANGIEGSCDLLLAAATTAPSTDDLFATFEIPLYAVTAAPSIDALFADLEDPITAMKGALSIDTLFAAFEVPAVVAAVNGAKPAMFDVEALFGGSFDILLGIFGLAAILPALIPDNPPTADFFPTLLTDVIVEDPSPPSDGEAALLCIEDGELDITDAPLILLARSMTLGDVLEMTALL